MVWVAVAKHRRRRDGTENGTKGPKMMGPKLMGPKTGPEMGPHIYIWAEMLGPKIEMLADMLGPKMEPKMGDQQKW